ncbi:MAG: phosphoribosylamine--glycine ligase [Verrucomicrobiota bacterium]|nr:phosphoribosylamine--glycine ligase [Verrucomicrobiota bacterium]MEC8656262.1 phosphoribosylamine--glycine ligase [Verrucomicrobiota bacterium]
MNDKNLNILVLGSGGREHTLAKVCSRSDCVGKVMVAPGNGGMSDEFEAHDLNIEDNSEIVRLAKEQQVDLVVVGPEVPLCNGAVDALNEAGVLAYGPDRAGARLEGSKAYTKDFLNKYGIPTAAYGNFSEIEPALAYLGELALPVVVKASGLAAGKGVLICQTLEEAEEAVRDMLAGESFGDSGKEVVIEEFLEGEEASLHLICSGESFVAMPMSQDHKKVGEGDTGLNTGGMGAYAPTQLVTPEMLAEYEQSIVRPTLAGLKSEGVDFRGTLYVGLMLTSEGAKVLEFNVRFGDPETQVILPLLADDLVPLLLQSARGEDMPEKVAFKNESSMVVVLTSAGYPESYPKGETIRIAEEIPRGSEVIHAGTQKNQAGEIVSAGGRVLGVVGTGETLALAREKAYALCGLIDFPSKFFRNDIGHREFSRTS